MSKKMGLLIFILSLTFSSGCDITEINKTAIPLGLGIDLIDNQMVISTELANPQTPEKASSADTPQFIVLSAEGKTVVEAARKIMLELPRVPLWSHSSLLIIGENVARRDMALIMDFFARNRFVRKNIPVLISSRSTPSEIFAVSPPIEAHPAIALKDVLQIQEKQLGIYVPIDMKEVEARFVTRGIEPLIPQVIIDNSGQEPKLTLAGAAVFNGRRMVGTFNETESRGYRWLSPKMISGGLILVTSPLDPKKQVTLELSRSQASIKPRINEDNITMEIAVKAEGNFYEQNETGEMFTRERFAQIEQNANHEIERQIRQCISKAQDLNSDVLGWGQLISRSYPLHWQAWEEDWENIFPAVQTEIKVEYSLRRSYLSNKSFVFR